MPVCLNIFCVSVHSICVHSSTQHLRSDVNLHTSYISGKWVTVAGCWCICLRQWPLLTNRLRNNELKQSYVWHHTIRYISLQMKKFANICINPCYVSTKHGVVSILVNERRISIHIWQMRVTVAVCLRTSITFASFALQWAKTIACVTIFNSLHKFDEEVWLILALILALFLVNTQY